jgi:outer membrane protein assembly factor BamB
MIIMTETTPNIRRAFVPRFNGLRRSFAFLFLALHTITGSDDWPGWRGPTRNGISPLKDLPVSWSPEHNIAWKAPVPGRGHSSPIVWGTRIFLTTDIEGELIPGKVIPKHTLMGKAFRNPDSARADHKHELKVLCYDAGTGKQLWERTVFSGEVYDEVHRTADYATSSPATDGRFLYASFGAQGFYKLDFNGNLIWKADLGKIDTLGLGYGPSPVLYEDKVIILADQDDGDKSFIAALSGADGRIVWKTPRKIMNSFGTPVIVDVRGKKQLIANGTPNVIAYDPNDGKEVWRSEGPNGVIVHTPVFGSGMVFASVGYPGKKTLAIRLDPADGENRVAWSYTRGTSYVPSPLYYDNYLYLMSDSGMLTCLDAKTGEVKYDSRRVPEPGRFTSSMTAFDGKILMTSDEGDTYIIQAGAEFLVMNKNSVGEPVVTSPALAGDSIYMRSDKSLIRIRNSGH